RCGQALSKTVHTKLTTVVAICHPFALNGEQFAHLYTGQSSYNRRQVIAEKVPAIIWAKAGYCIVVIFITEDNTFDRSFNSGHTMPRYTRSTSRRQYQLDSPEHRPLLSLPTISDPHYSTND